VFDSLRLRRFCLVALEARVREESRVGRLTRGLGAELVAELSRLVIARAQRERRFRAWAVGIDSRVVAADLRYPSGSGLAAEGGRTLAREGKRLSAKASGEALAPLALQRTLIAGRA